VFTINPDELQRGEAIGEGAFGTVYRGKWGDIPVAIKELREVHITCEEIKEEFDREVQFMKTVRHPNIVVFFGAGQHANGVPFLVTELMEQGTLSTLLKEKTQLSGAMRALLSLDAASGLDHIHRLNRVHRDVKPGNMLLTNALRVKVADFGTSKLTMKDNRSERATKLVNMGDTSNVKSAASDDTSADGNRQQSMTLNVGTPAYMAPELLRGKSYNASVDVWAFGIVVWQINTQKVPWEEVPGHGFKFVLNLTDHIGRGGRLSMPVSLDPRVASLINRCLDLDPKLRPSFGEIVQALKQQEGG
jgi:serine/threonine protein kinase